MIEKLIEFHIPRSGLTIASSKQKSPKPLETLRILDLAYNPAIDTIRNLRGNRVRYIYLSLTVFKRSIQREYFSS